MNSEAAARDVLRAMNSGRATTSAKLSRRTGYDQAFVRELLRGLAADGYVQRRGRTKGTTWTQVKGATPARVLVRDAALRLRGFTLDELCEAVPTLRRATVRHYLKEYEKRGTFKPNGFSGKRKRYAYVRPTGPVRARERRQPPEAQFVDRRGGGRPIPGTGRPDRPTDREVAQLFEEITAAGATYERRASHWAVRYGGQIICTVPCTPSDRRSLANARATIRRAGLPLGEAPGQGLYSPDQPEPT